MSKLTLERLQRELKGLQKNPPPFIRAKPSENDLLIWHYVIEGAPDTPYYGGWYHGTLNLPSNFPLKPPAVRMITPSGRFAPNEKICLSLSDFHPETWQPTWGIDKILLGLQSFMNTEETTVGSVKATKEERNTYALNSLDFNCNNTTFRKLFPELVELRDKRKAEMDRLTGSSSSSAASSDSVNSVGTPNSTTTMVGGGGKRKSPKCMNKRLRRGLFLLVIIVAVLYGISWYRRKQLRNGGVANTNFPEL